MARKPASVLADYDALAERFRKGIASEEDAGEALSLLRDPEFFQTLKADLLKGGDEDEEDEPDMRRRGRRDDDDEEENEEEGGGDDDEEEGGGDDDEEEEAPPRRKFGKAIVPEYGSLGEMIEGPNGELLLNADQPISDLAKAVTGMGEENAAFFGALLGEFRAMRTEVRDLRKSFDALLEQAEEIAQEEDEAPPANAPPAELQKSIADSMDEFREMASRLDGIEKAIAERSPHGRLPQDQNGNGHAQITTAQAIEIFRKGLQTGELPEDKYHDGCRALVGRGVDPASVLERFYRKGLRSFIENES
jgi:hypothetical protein